MAKVPKNRFGITMVEIVIVAAIASLVMTMAMLIMNRTTRHFKKGTDLLNVQRLMDNIVERIRTDVRSLKHIDYDRSNEKAFTFNAIRDGSELEISYHYDEELQTLFRNEGGLATNFHGAKQVKSFVFLPELDEFGKFKYLNVVMQLISDEPGGGVGSTLSIACQFYSTCVETELKISNLRSNRN